MFLSPITGFIIVLENIDTKYKTSENIRNKPDLYRNHINYDFIILEF